MTASMPIRWASALPSPGSFDAVVQQHPGFNFEPASNPRNVVDRDVALGPLDATEIGAVDAALVGQRFLAQTTLRPEATHILRQNVPQRSFVSLFHKGISAR